MKFLALLAPALLLVSCAGYHLGESKPVSLERVKTIAVPMFENSTLHPRAEALATSAVAAAFVQDGTYRISDRDHCDAVLEGSLSGIKYAPIRGRRYNTLAPEELANTVTLKWILRDGKDPTKILASGTSNGTSQLFVSDNLQTAKNNALPEALDRAGVALVSRLANGY
ncbi:LPS assembly lipoprotein LptE [Luteolibacter sp.]|uniref:LPS assembly lipoprotein LptE n=1 Tax=Luteolibacter sp. TaxID=1962973 RepID=UPI003266B5C5